MGAFTVALWYMTSSKLALYPPYAYPYCYILTILPYEKVFLTSLSDKKRWKILAVQTF